ncbi:MAG: YebC/PmpR family DNA-binding transcriptional regulator [Christensenellales bacterium]|jgi:YebC/PmpR family DNA-binding regulatory protein
MSGHSKWANIKHKKAKGDAEKGKIFTKVGREIAVAVKEGGSDPLSNSRLRDAIAKAKENNIPNDNIMRSIKKASGELGNVNYEDIVYEGYAAGGIAVIVEALTENKNRTAGDVRHLFDKNGGSLGQSNCVSYMFDRKGVIIIDAEGLNEDDLFMLAIEAGADDIITGEEIYEIYTVPSEYSKVRENLEKQGLKILESDIEYIPQNTIKIESEEIESKVRKLIEMLEDLDDVQNVYHNGELDE